MNGYKPYNIIRLCIIAVTVLWFIEAITGLLQLVGALPSGHPSYPVTGSFYNPGPYACFLSIAFPIGLRLAIARQKRLYFIGFSMIVISAILIPSSMSRTAWAACAIGALVALWDKGKPVINKMTATIKILSIITIVTCIFGAYSVKSDSASGRLLMWKIGANAAVSVPTTGVGWSNVAGIYGDCQEQYFRSGKATLTEEKVADAPRYVFNEYIQTAIAFGIPAMILIICLISGALYAALQAGCRGIAGSVAASAIVMAGSYPLQFPLFTTAICMLLIAAYMSGNSSVLRYAGAVVTVTCGILFIKGSRSVDIDTKFKSAHRLHIAGNYRESTERLKELLPNSSDPMILNIIGKNYQALGMPDSAEHYFSKSCYRCPNRMYPHYLLMKLYNDSSYYNKSKLIREANFIISTQEKVSSSATAEMRQEALKIFDNEHKKRPK